MSGNAARVGSIEGPKVMSVAAKRITPSDDAGPTGHRAQLPGAGALTIGPESEAGIDRALLSRIANGEQAAFGTMMQRHLSAVLMTARRILNDEAEAEDLAQEAFLRLWRTALSLEVGEYGLRPWLRRVTSNLAIDHLRKSKRFSVTDEVPEQAEAPRQLHAIEADQSHVRVEQALASLPQRQRIALSLFHFDELSQREVSEMMELSEDALESLLARGRRRLKEILKDDWRELLVDQTD